VVSGRELRSNTRGSNTLKIDFKTLKMMQLRSSPGEVLDRVARDGEVFVIERNGQPKACLVPVSFLLPDIPPDRLAQELAGLKEKDEKHGLTINDNHELEITFRDHVGSEAVGIDIVLPHGYPNSAPRIYAVDLVPDTPKRWPDGSLALFGTSTAWNSQTHDVVYALNSARRWLKQYRKWRQTGEWPEDN
jgi:prevent-host-death family protein